MAFAEELSLLIRTHVPLIYVLTAEEERAEQAIEQVAQSVSPHREVVCYDLVHGFSKDGQAKNNFLQGLQSIENLPPQSPLIYIFRDLHRRLSPQKSDEAIVRQLRHLYRTLRFTRQTVIILSPVLELPTELQEQVIVVDFPLPSAQEIHQAIKSIISPEQMRLKEHGIEQLVKSCLGLTYDRIRQVLAKSIVQKQTIDETDIDLVLAEKRQRIRQTEVLEFFAPSETLANIGGLENLKIWLTQRQRAFSEEARQFGLPNPKGLLMVGIQGTGKSLCAKAIAHLWRLPLLRLDVGRLFGSLVGQSESRTRQTIQLAEALAPCVLWLDEIDKAFAGSGSGASGDSGTSQRVLATILTWMQEKTSPVFVVSTANNIAYLPPELLRKGRFDEIFFINLPTEEERRQIFAVHLQKYRPLLLRQFDLDLLAEKAKDFSGAEIEQAIVEGMYRAFHLQRDVTMEDILGAIADTYPLASTAREQIQAMQSWAAQGRARSASLSKCESRENPTFFPQTFRNGL
jgi:SpoVK/Ycf46/Vps4 family AAA+-type ATPase